MIFLSGLVALAAAQNPLAGVPGQLPENASNVRFQTVAQGNDLATNSPGLFVFNEPVAWSNYWRANHAGATPAPFLENGFFNNWRLVAIHAGLCPTEGYGLTVARMDRRISRATVSVVEVVPPRGARYRAHPTAPWILLRVERGAFDFDLQVRRVEGYPGAQVVSNGTTLKIGGTTVIFGPGYCPPK